MADDNIPIPIPTPTPAAPSAFPDPALPAAGTGVPDTSTTSDPLGDLARGVVEAATDALAAVARLWAADSVPLIGQPGADGVATPSAAVGLLQGSLSWYTAAVAVAAVLIAGGRMAWQRRGQAGADLLRGLGTLVLVAGAGVTAVSLLVAAADGFSDWVLGQVTDDLEGSLTGLLGLAQTDGMPDVLTILVGTAALLAAALQVVLLVARGAVLVVLTGVLPLSASATNTETGRAFFTRTLIWIVAFALYQPAAALILATGFLIAPDVDGGDAFIAALTGVTFLALALAALPALLRLLRPVVGAATTRGGAAFSGAGGALPTGARLVPRISQRSGAGAAGSASGAAAVRAPVRAPARAAGRVAAVDPAGVSGGRAGSSSGRPAGDRSGANGAVDAAAPGAPWVPSTHTASPSSTHSPLVTRPAGRPGPTGPRPAGEDH